MTMRFVPFLFVFGLITGCATTPTKSEPSTNIAGLPTSDLRPGECALFGWSTDDVRSFIFYADKKTARYDGFDGPIDLEAQTPFPATIYEDSAGRKVTLRLGEGQTMDGGLRYPGARIVTLTDEGWERLQPVAIVRTCQPKS